MRGRLGLLALCAVGAGFLVAQLLLFSIHRAPSWDESVYLSQVTPHATAVAFAPSRARGITFLVAPVTLSGGSIAAVRLYLEVASAIALVAAFAAWLPVLGAGAALAAFLFGFSWLGLFYGSEVMPNLWAALAGVAALGVAAPVVEGDRRRWRAPVAGLLLFAMASIRPPDAAVVALPLLVALAVRRSFRAAAIVGGGLVLGWAPWAAEMAVRFGGLGGALRQGGSVGHLGVGGAGYRLVQHLRLTDGPPLGPDHGGIPVAGALWWAGLVALTLVAVLAIRTAPLIVAAASGVAAAGLYVLFVGGLAPRFLLPAYGLLAVTSAAGAMALVRGARWVRAAGLAVLAAALAWAVWQGAVASRIEREQARTRAEAWAVGLELSRLSAGDRCAFASTDAFPQLQLASGCSGRPVVGDVAAAAGRLSAQRTTVPRLFLVERTAEPVVPPRWRVAGSLERGMWTVLER